jgi:hypothetical protein
MLKAQIQIMKQKEGFIKKKIILAFEDETWLELNPAMKATWMKKGYQKLVLTPGKNKRINAFITILWPIKAIKYNIFKARNSRLLKRHLRAFKAYS